MQSGGPVTSHGLIFGHENEEMSPAKVVQGGKTTLERINQAVAGGLSGGLGGITVNLSVNVDRVDSKTDLNRLIDGMSDQAADKIVFKVRNRLDRNGERGIAYLRG